MCPQSPFWKQSLLKPAMFNLDKKLLSLLSPWGFLCTCSSCYFDSFLLGIHSDPRGISVSRLVSMYCFVLFFLYNFNKDLQGTRGGEAWCCVLGVQKGMRQGTQDPSQGRMDMAGDSGPTLRHVVSRFQAL